MPEKPKPSPEKIQNYWNDFPDTMNLQDLVDSIEYFDEQLWNIRLRQDKLVESLNKRLGKAKKHVER